MTGRDPERTWGTNKNGGLNKLGRRFLQATTDRNQAARLRRNLSPKEMPYV